MAIVAIHEDIIRTHVLTKLDGQTLTATSCASSWLHSLCSDTKLWSNSCSTNWPSTNHPIVTHAISNFPSGHHSFFSNSFSSPSQNLTTMTSISPTTELISSVDIKYRDKLVFSKVVSTNTTPTNLFQSSPFCIDLLEQKELVPSMVKLSSDDDHVIQSNLEKHVTLSWIVIDTTHNRAVNLSSIKPVLVQRNLLTDEIELTFASDVSCNIEVTCGVKGGGELYVSGVSLTVQDMDGKCLSGKDSMVILQGLKVADRRCSDGGDGQKERYVEYIQRRIERKQKEEMREMQLYMACFAIWVAFLVAVWSFALYWIKIKTI